MMDNSQIVHLRYDGESQLEALPNFRHHAYTPNASPSAMQRIIKQKKKSHKHSVVLRVEYKITRFYHQLSLLFIYTFKTKP